MENKNNKCGLRRIELLKKKCIKWKIKTTKAGCGVLN
jgi:hypothetical protein